MSSCETSFLVAFYIALQGDRRSIYDLCSENVQEV